MPETLNETRRVQIGEKHYIDTGTGWRMRIEGSRVPMATTLTRGESAYVEARWVASHCSVTGAQSGAQGRNAASLGGNS